MATEWTVTASELPNRATEAGSRPKTKSASPDSAIRARVSTRLTAL